MDNPHNLPPLPLKYKDNKIQRTQTLLDPQTPKQLKLRCKLNNPNKQQEKEEENLLNLLSHQF